jgi:hypothetical protein
METPCCLLIIIMFMCFVTTGPVDQRIAYLFRRGDEKDIRGPPMVPFRLPLKT